MTTSTILLIGANGQLGRELRRALRPLGEVVCATRERGAAGGRVLDIEDGEAIRRTVAEVRPSLIVNAAAYTAVDQAEDEPERAHRVNALAPGILAEAAAGLGALLIHYSTDYVFSGDGERPYCEEDPTAPINVYGESKELGERAIRATGVPHFILRTSWLYAARGRNFVHTILRRAASGAALSVVDDQVGAPTSARFLADTTARILNRLAGEDRERLNACAGTYHVASAGRCSWYEFAARILALRCAAAPGVELTPTSSSAYVTKARRPRFSVLDCARVQHAFALNLSSWEQQLAGVMAEIGDAEGC